MPLEPAGKPPRHVPPTTRAEEFRPPAAAAIASEARQQLDFFSRL